MKEPRLQKTPSLVDLNATVTALEARVATLERLLNSEAGKVRPPDTPVSPGARPVQSSPAGHNGLQLASLGIAILMLAGAFLLRALTDSGFLNATLGLSLGFAYMLSLLLLTDRAAAGGERPRAILYGLASVLVTYPFLWETASQLGLLPAPVASGLMILVTALGLGVSLRHGLVGLAWVVLLSTLVTCTALYWAAEASPLFAAIIVALGVATVWLGYLRDWQGPQWLAAAAANLLVILTVMLSARPATGNPVGPLPAPGTVLPLSLALPVLYLGSFFLRTLSFRREVGAFEIVQSAGCLLTGYLGGIVLLNHLGSNPAALGWASLVMALASYALGFTLVRRHQGRGRNFFYFAYLGLVFTLTSTALVVPGHWLSLLWGLLGVAGAIAGGYFDRWTLRIHCTVYLIGAAALSGIPAVLYDSLVASTTSSWHSLSGAGIAVWLLAIICYLLLSATRQGQATPVWRRVPRFLVAGLVLIGVDSLLVAALAELLSNRVPGPAAATVAATRTAVLAATIVILAAASRRERLRELSWFVNPLLILTGLKLLFEDLRRGTPVSLFFGFALFGVALILAPRLRPRPGGARTPDRPAQATENTQST